MGQRNSSGFRYSDSFISRWSTVLGTLMIALPIIGIGIGLSSDGDWAPEWLGTFAGVFVIVGFTGPLLAAAVLGGEAIHRGGGLVGALLTYAIVGGAAGQSLGIGWLLWTGVGAGVVAVAGFWILGWRAGVPMFIGLPWRKFLEVQRQMPGAEPNPRSGNPASRQAARDLDTRPPT